METIQDDNGDIDYVEMLRVCNEHIDDESTHYEDGAEIFWLSERIKYAYDLTKKDKRNLIAVWQRVVANIEWADDRKEFASG